MKNNKVKIIILETTRVGCDICEPSVYIVKQNGMQHGYFKIKSYESAHQAWNAAMALSASLEKNPWVSPFEVYRSVILDYYGTAAKLRRIVISLWNGVTFPFDLSDISGIDDKHYEILLELLGSYRKFGENDKAFMNLAQEIRHNWLKTNPDELQTDKFTV